MSHSNAKDTVIGTSAGVPLTYNRVGELPELIQTVRGVRKLAEEHIATLTALRQKELHEIFTQPDVWLDPSSQWYNFTHDRIDRRLEWLSNLMKYAGRDLANLEQSCQSFTDHWDRDVRIFVDEEGQAFFVRLHKIYRALETSLQHKESDGPYRVEVMSECRSHLNQLEGAITALEYDRTNTWRSSDSFYPHAQNWFRQSSALWSLEAPSSKETVLEHTASRNSTPLASDNRQDRDLEKCSPSIRNGRVQLSSKHWICLVVICVLIATVYSTSTRDVQTGFTIGATLLAAGSILLKAIEKLGKGKIALD